jgi:SAM-dependent methyltransferase/uncharacterized protein YbaR (Trm112 family)
MRETLLSFLNCPVCKNKLRLQIIKTAVKKFKTDDEVVVESGVLSCTCDFLFPIVQNVPRMLVESFMEHESFLKQNVHGFIGIKQNLLRKHGDLIQTAKKRNRHAKESFSFEWDLLKGNGEVNVWNLDRAEYRTQLFNELDLPAHFYENKIAIDVGCGHGRSTILLGEQCKAVIGIDLGRSVVKAFADNISANCHFIQADLHFPPFANNSFDIVYSSGVLHHTDNTEKAFTIISQLVKKGGVYCVWLYKPFHNHLHRMVIGWRKITVHLSLRVQFWLYLIFLVPVYKLSAWIRRRKPRPWREIMIELMDSLSPRYRFEYEPDEVKSWFVKGGFTDIKTTTLSNIGFSMRGSR